MKLRNIKNLPVFDQSQAGIVAKVNKAVVSHNSKIAFLIVENDRGDLGLIERNDFSLTEEAVIIKSDMSIKPYYNGEELSMQDEKIGDTIYSLEGRELGTVSDLVVSLEKKEICAVEISDGAIKDILEGRDKIPINKVLWKNEMNALVKDEGTERK
ncbi:MAG: PRC-barrel domain-containing protein [Syntrophomonadaceae bacterium]